MLHAVPRSRPTGLLRVLIALVAAAFLAGCRTELYSNLNEFDANQMLAVLMANGVDAEKVALGKAGFSVRVGDRDVLRALALLNERGFPKSERESIGKVFQKTGIMSSPFEERVRYIYALGEEVAKTLSYVDGVVTARVHIVLPDTPQLGQPVRPSSAAVFIKHRPGVDLDFFVPQIRRLVSSSIEGLQYTAVTVVLSEAAPVQPPVVPLVQMRTVEVLPGLEVRDTDVGRFWQFLFMAMAVFAVAVAGAGAGALVLLRRRQRKRPATDATTTTPAVLEPT